jgi:hypothetical protein
VAHVLHLANQHARMQSTTPTNTGAAATIYSNMPKITGDTTYHLITSSYAIQTLRPISGPTLLE